MAEAEDQAYKALLTEFQARARALGREIPDLLLTQPPSRTRGTEEVGGEDPGGATGQRLRANLAAGYSSHMQDPQFMEKTPSNLPIEEFPYGKPGVDWNEYAFRFEGTAKAATNAQTQERVDQICCTWLPLKLPDDAQPIYRQCQHKNNWTMLKAELEVAFEDPMIRRRWSRDLGAYKRPPGMTLQVYNAKIIGYVHRYSPHVVNDPKAYANELYVRFIHGLDDEYKAYIEESIPFGKETIQNACNQAIKLELKKQERNQGARVGMASTDGKKSQMENMKQDLAGLKASLSALTECQVSSSESSSYEEDTSGSEDFNAIQAEDEDSDAEEIQKRAQSMSKAVTKAIMEGMKGLKVKPKSSIKSRSKSGKE